MLNQIDYLRVSLTNKCNLRCIYCHPLSDNTLCKYQGILELNEILHIIRLFVKCGIKRVRLTGGEPTLRNDILQLIRQLALTEGIDLHLLKVGDRVFFSKDTELELHKLERNAIRNVKSIKY